MRGLGGVIILKRPLVLMCIFLIAGIIASFLGVAYVVIVPLGTAFFITLIWVAGRNCSLFVMGKFEFIIILISFVFYGCGVYKNYAVTKIYEKYDELMYGEMKLCGNVYEIDERKEKDESLYEIKGKHESLYDIKEKHKSLYEIKGNIVEIKENTYGYTISLELDEGLVYVYTDCTICGLLDEATKEKDLIRQVDDKKDLTGGADNKKDSIGETDNENKMPDEKSIESVLACLYGRDVIILGEIIPMERARNFGNYDEYKILRSKGVLLKLSAESIYLSDSKKDGVYYLNVNEIQLNEELEKVTTSGKIYKIKNHLRRILFNITPEKEFGILAAMVLGDNTELDKDVKELYSLSGISHIMSISGLHISLIGMGLYKLLRKKMRYVSSATISLGIMAMFLIFIGNPISATRAVIMFFVHIFADLFGRKYDVLSALSLAAILILMDNPYYILNASFQLSFIAIIAVCVSAPIITSLLFKDKDEKESKKKLRDKREDKGQERENGWQGNGNEGKERENGWQGSGHEGQENVSEKSLSYLILAYIRNIALAIARILTFNIAMTITLMPLNAYLFFRHSTYSPLINMIVVPLVGLVLAMTLMGILFAIFLPIVGTFFVGTAVCLLRFFTWLSEKIMSLPYANVVTGKFSLVEVIFCYIILMLGLVIAWRVVENRKSFLVMFTFIFLFIVFREKFNMFTLCFLDVGQGACIYIKSASGNDYLIDGGSSDERNVGEYKIEPFLEARQVEKLEYVFVTHCDTDHISGILELIERNNISIDNLVLPDISDKDKDDKYIKLIDLAKRREIEVIFMKAGDKLKDDQMILSCINPSGSATNINDSSLVFVLEYAELAAVFTGDIGKEVEKEILDDLELILHNGDEKNDDENDEINDDENGDKLVVYDVAHHGSANSNSEEFVNLIRPDISVISCGKDNSYGHPAEEVLKCLEDVGSEILCTFNCGQIEIYEEKGKIMLREFVDE